MKSPKEVFEDYCGRRKAILKALTTDVDKFSQQCDPNKENLCLYGYPDGTWVVDLPAEEVPPEVPEPALGINFARDGMQRKDWIGLVAVHSDAWLLALAFYKGARLSREEREELFEMVNSLPSCYEIVSGRVKVNQPHSQPQAQQQTSIRKRSAPPTTSGGNAVRVPPRSKSPKMSETDEDEPEPEPEPDCEDDDGWNDGDGDPCPQCRRKYRTDEFWIACDFCDTWYCGRCAKMTEAKAQRVKHWKCPQCPQR